MLARLLFAVALMVALPAVGSAEFAVFTDRAAWQAAAGTPTATEDFEGFTADALFYPDSVPANGFSIVATDTLPPFFGNKVEALPFAPPFGSRNSPNGTNYLWGALINDPDNIGDSSEVNVILTFTGATTAFGADLRGANDTFIDVYDAGNGLLGTITPTGPATQFYGFALTGGERADRVVFRTVPTDADGVITVNGFGLDNAQSVSTPVPSGLLLTVLGLPALGLSRRPRRAGSITR